MLRPLILETPGFATVAVLAALSSVTESCRIAILASILAILSGGETELVLMRDWLPTTTLPTLQAIFLAHEIARLLARPIFMHVVPSIEGEKMCWQGYLSAAPAVADVNQRLDTLDRVAEGSARSVYPSHSSAPRTLV